MTSWADASNSGSWALTWITTANHLLPHNMGNILLLLGLFVTSYYSFLSDRNRERKMPYSRKMVSSYSSHIFVKSYLWRPDDVPLECGTILDEFLLPHTPDVDRQKPILLPTHFYTRQHLIGRDYEGNLHLWRNPPWPVISTNEWRKGSIREIWARHDPGWEEYLAPPNPSESNMVLW